MPLSHYLCCFWPGLPELWFRGRWTGLPSAIAFAIALNLLLVARFIYPQWLEPLFVRTFFWGLVAVWLLVFFRAVRGLPLMLAPREALGVEDQYDAARSEYLKGHWYEAEALLAECLDVDERDAPALLLLASVYRQTQRFDAAARTLAELDTLETADYWWLERDIEQRRLENSRRETLRKGNEDESGDRADADSGQPSTTKTEDSADTTAVEMASHSGD